MKVSKISSLVAYIKEVAAIAKLEPILDVFPGESLMGLAHRLAKSYQHDTLYTLVQPQGNHFDYRANMNYIKDKNLWNNSIVTFLKNNGFEELYKLSLNQYDELLFGGCSTLLEQRQHYYQTKVKYCPCCLKEAHYHRLIWDVSMVGVCLKHNRFLIENCPGCGCVIRLNKLIGGACLCGEVFSEVDADVIPTNDVIFAQQTIQGLLTGEISNIQIEEGITLSGREYFMGIDLFSKLLDGIPVKSLSFMDYKVNLKEVNYSLIKGSKRTFEMVMLLSTTAHNLLVQPSSDFARVIEVIEINRECNRLIKYKRELFDKIIANKNFEAHRRIYTNFHVSNMTEFARLKYILKPDEFRYCSMSQARKILNCDDLILKKLEKSGVLKFYKAPYGQHREVHLVEIDSIMEYSRKRKELINSREVALMLGVPGNIVRWLSDINLLEIEHGPGKDNFGQRKYHPDAVKNFLKKLESKCERNEHINSSEWIPFNKENLKKIHYHCGFIAVVNLVLEGKIRCRRVGEVQKVQDVFLNRQDLNDFADNIFNKK